MMRLVFTFVQAVSSELEESKLDGASEVSGIDL